MGNGRTLILAIVGAIAAISLLTWGVREQRHSQSLFSLEAIAQQIEQSFPDVSAISTQTLTQWQQSKKPFLLLDIRERPEYEVSHLKNALNVPPKTPVAQLTTTALKTVPKDYPIVVYCSVGYRSAQYARLLQKAGYQQVYNLEGSIFAWANEGRPLFQGDRPSQQVHPYDAKWGKLLKPQYRAL
jgi:rhodanese-related sulfurtransferase